MEHKSGNISETRKDMKSYIRRAYRNLLTLFRTVPSPTPYGLTFPKIEGSQSQPKTAVVISGTGKATDFEFGRYFTGSIRTKAHKNFGQK